MDVDFRIHALHLRFHPKQFQINSKRRRPHKTILFSYTSITFLKRKKQSNHRITKCNDPLHRLGRLRWRCVITIRMSLYFVVIVFTAIDRLLLFVLLFDCMIRIIRRQYGGLLLTISCDQNSVIGVILFQRPLVAALDSNTFEYSSAQLSSAQFSSCKLIRIPQELWETKKSSCINDCGCPAISFGLVWLGLR